MRLIGMNGVDVLYDAVALVPFDGTIQAMPVMGGERQIVMAQYSSPELAEMAMQQLHAKYQMMNVSVFQFPSEESLIAIRNVERGGWVD